MEIQQPPAMKPPNPVKPLGDGEPKPREERNLKASQAAMHPSVCSSSSINLIPLGHLPPLGPVFISQ